MNPPQPSADPDPTTQIPWPASRREQGSSTPQSDRLGVPESHVRFAERPRSPSQAPPKEPGKTRLTVWDLMFLSVSMLGAQITWSVELGFGSPFLVNLGLSETMTSLVWLAGPISGLVAQPLIGAISDSSTSKYRRRFWISLSTAVLVVAFTTLAYCEAWASFLVDFFGGGQGDWDPEQKRLAQNTAIGLAVVALYLLDFALNALQASLRNLLLDIAPADQLNAGNAWHGRMTHAGNIVGFSLGALPLNKVPIVRALGGNQFRKLCIVSMVILVVTVWITCATQEEKERPQTFNRSTGKLSEVIANIRTAILKLPRPIRRVCFVQLFAFMGWFPFLFYSTLYIGQVMAYERQTDPTVDEATRIGELAMLIYSFVAIAAGTLLPILAARDSRLLAHAGDDNSDAEMTRIRNTILEWRAEAARQGRPLKLPYMPFLLRNIWTGALLLFTILMWSTFLVTTVYQAVVLVSFVGICWAVACWVPFAIIMEFLKEGDSAPKGHEVPGRPDNYTRGNSPRRPSHTRYLSTPAYLNSDRAASNERTPLMRGRSMDDSDAIADDDEREDIAGGTVLGIHNLAIVCPQFIVAVVSSAIFRFADQQTEPIAGGHENVYLGKNGVAWVLRFGGLCTLIAAVIARAVPPTNTEKAMRRRLAHMKTLKEAATP